MAIRKLLLSLACLIFNRKIGRKWKSLKSQKNISDSLFKYKFKQNFARNLFLLPFFIEIRNKCSLFIQYTINIPSEYQFQYKIKWQIY